MNLTHNEIDTLIIIERCTASLSVFSTLLLLTTFLCFKEFRTLSNTLICYASFANLGANVAALIGGSALSKESSGLCQFQAFLLEMFMQSDPMWSLAMAVNVYLVFFFRFDAHQLKRLYWLYGLICYGIPFIPAMVCLLLRVHGRGQIYGNATLWCWIDGEWAIIRIYSYYIPVWFCIVFAILIYIRVGVEIFQKRNKINALGGNATTETYTSTSAPPHSGPSPFTGVRTTEIEVTHDPWLIHDGNITAPPAQVHKKDEKENYSITITAREGSRPSGMGFKRPKSIDKVKWAYMRVALLFGCSILVTWVPASINRIWGLKHPGQASYATNIGSAIVLPLQGFWNTVIYFSTSLPICRRVWARFHSRARADDHFHQFDMGGISSQRAGGESLVGLSAVRSHISREGSTRDDMIRDQSTREGSDDFTGSF